jgi:hypothetical protein
MKNKKVAIIAFVVGIVFSLSTMLAFASVGLWNRGLEKPPIYPVNENGLTYGSAADAISIETEPDLISAVGVDGVEGYVYSKDLQGEMPKTPEEAVTITKALEEKLSTANPNEPVIIRTIPLYDVDGKTVIGEFAITNFKNTSNKD